jgi:Heterokaryon incompatibility protein (HET)
MSNSTDHTMEASVNTLCEDCQALDLSLANILRLQGLQEPGLFAARDFPVLREWSGHELETSATTCRICRFFFDISLSCGRKGIDYRFHVGKITPPRKKQAGAIFAPYMGFDAWGIEDHSERHGWIPAAVVAYHHPSSSDLPDIAFTAQKLLLERADFEKIKRWFQRCRRSHKGNCSDPKPSITNWFARPSQQPRISVIDCISKKVMPYKPDLGHYATLSYVWGPVPGAPADPVTGCLPSPIPKTIQDALTVCITLGIPYLWVDRYCIPQHDLIEKSRQIGTMDRIYNNSTLTIVAAAGDGPERGLPGVNDTPRTVQFPSLAFGQDTWVYLPNFLFSEEIQKSMWNSRAWTYQESVVSRRRLVFSESQVHFECPTENLWEVVDIRPDCDTVFGTEYTSYGGDGFCGLHRTAAKYRAFPDWKSIHDFDICLQEFFGRHMSDPKDTVNALGGVISWFNKRHGRVWSLSGLVVSAWRKNDHYLWSRHGYECLFLDALCWTHSTMVKRKPEFPSWTWAGWDVDNSSSTPDYPQYLIWNDRKTYFGGYLCMQQIKVGKRLGPSPDAITWLNIKDLKPHICDPMLHADYLWLDAWTFHGKITEYDINTTPPKLRITLPSTWSYSRQFPPEVKVGGKEIWVSKAELEIIGLSAEVLILPICIRFNNNSKPHWSREIANLPVLILKSAGSTTSLGLGNVQGVELPVYQRIGSSFMTTPRHESFKDPAPGSEKLKYWNIDFFQRVSGMKFEKKIFILA